MHAWASERLLLWHDESGQVMAVFPGKSCIHGTDHAATPIDGCQCGRTGVEDRVEIAGQQVPAMNPAAAQAAAVGQTVTPLTPAVQSQGTSPVATNQIFRPNDRTTSRGATSASTSAPAGTPAAPSAQNTAPVVMPKLHINSSSGTNDILAAMSEAMARPSTSPAAASKVYELQQMLFQAHKDCLSVWTSARNG